MKPGIEVGRISDLGDTRKRADWSEINGKLKALEPGQRLSIKCPDGMKVSALRSTILTNGRRFHKGEWSLTTRTDGRVVHCFLSQF